jgi:hypothetical protein
MSTKQNPSNTESLRDLFVEVTGDKSVTDEQEGDDRREASDEAESLAGRTEQESLDATIEMPDESF